VFRSLRADNKDVPFACPHCGREAERRESFCEGCGAFLAWDAGQVAESQVLAQEVPPQEDQRAAVQIKIKDGLIEVAPGNAQSTTFTIKNLGTQVEEFRFSLTGPEWLVVEPATVSVYPRQEAVGAIQAAPPRGPSSTAGAIPFWLTVTSALHAHVSSSAAGRVDVAPFYELAAELVPTSTIGRGSTRHHITLDNRGNVPLRIALNPVDVAEGLQLTLPGVVEVAPGKVAEVPVAVHGPFRWFGRPEPRTFSITAEPPEPLAPARMSGTRVIVPTFPKWVLAAAAGIVAAAVAATVLIPKATAHNQPGGSAHASSPAAARSSAAPSSPASSAASSSSAASASPSSSPSSPPSSPVPVPDVTGNSLQSAEAILSNQHFVPQPQASYDGPSASPGAVAGTNPTAGASASPGSTVQVIVPTGTYDLASSAPSARWTATSEFQPPSITLPFGGPETANTGAVLLPQQVTLEDGTVPREALETVPPPLKNGIISGLYTLSNTVIAGEEFRADIGFRQGTGGQIEFQIIATEANGSDRVIYTGVHYAGTPLADVAVPLDAGTTQLTLSVQALDLRQSRDDVIWVDPRIEEANAPAEPLRATASASSSATQAGTLGPGF
jgi:PASTA domain